MNNVTFGGTLNGRAFVYYETIGGGHGAGPLGHGISGRHSHMTNTRNTPVEALEYTLPVRVLAYHLHDAGGEGRFRGGDGITRTYQFLAPAMLTVNSERRRFAPYGLNGGQPAAPGRNILVKQGQPADMSGKFSARVGPGDLLIVETPGGGGWGQSL
jgi:N-methylhydantoinase B